MKRLVQSLLCVALGLAWVGPVRPEESDAGREKRYYVYDQRAEVVDMEARLRETSPSATTEAPALKRRSEVWNSGSRLDVAPGFTDPQALPTLRGSEPDETKPQTEPRSWISALDLVDQRDLFPEEVETEIPDVTETEDAIPAWEELADHMSEPVPEVTPNRPEDPQQVFSPDQDPERVIGRSASQDPVEGGLGNFSAASDVATRETPGLVAGWESSLPGLSPSDDVSDLEQEEDFTFSRTERAMSGIMDHWRKENPSAFPSLSPSPEPLGGTTAWAPASSVDSLGAFAEFQPMAIQPAEELSLRANRAVISLASESDAFALDGTSALRPEPVAGGLGADLVGREPVGAWEPPAAPSPPAVDAPSPRRNEFRIGSDFNAGFPIRGFE